MHRFCVVSDQRIEKRVACEKISGEGRTSVKSGHESRNPRRASNPRPSAALLLRFMDETQALEGQFGVDGGDGLGLGRNA